MGEIVKRSYILTNWLTINGGLVVTYILNRDIMMFHGLETKCPLR